jgi:hypothetical protein
MTDITPNHPNHNKLHSHHQGTPGILQSVNGNYHTGILACTGIEPNNQIFPRQY